MILRRLLDVVTWPFRPGSVPFQTPDFSPREAMVVSRHLASRMGRTRLVRSVIQFVEHNAADRPHPSVPRKIRAALDAVRSIEPDIDAIGDAYGAVDVWEVMSS